MRNSAILRGKKKSATGSLFGLFAVVLAAAVVTALYFGRELLVPLALAALLTFVLAPLVSRIERFVGRVTAVSGVAALSLGLIVAVSWVITRQAMDLMEQLPSYRVNITRKLHALEPAKDSSLKRFSKMIAEIESEIPAFGTTPVPPVEEPGSRSRRNDAATRPAITPIPTPVPATTPATAPVPTSSFNQLPTLLWPFLEILATGGIVIVLVIFMLLKREDLRGRLIKITGQGRISSTSRVMEDAAARVSRYLITQLVVNTAFGITVGIGLYFIGIPNAFLWGALSAVLRFIPYAGAWLAAFCPMVLALAISPGWEMVLLTLGLFVLLEIITANVLEPMLYCSSTGVSSLALIVAAIFWTWLWGPIGLLLSTPVTVCLAVLGRHVPRLSFFNILLGSEEALSPAEDCYHRLLVEGLSEAGKIVDTYIAANSLTAAYDKVLIPTLTMAEMDFQREELDETQRVRVLQGAKDIINDLGSRPATESQVAADQSVAASVSAIPPGNIQKSDCRVVTVSPRGERDEIAGFMLAHLLREQGFEATTTSPGLPLAQTSTFIEEFRADVVCISVIPPTTLIHARHLCNQLRAKHPTLRIVVGVWGATENLEDAIKSLRAAGADEVVVSLAEAVVQFVKFSSTLAHTAFPFRLPGDETARLEAVMGLSALAERTNPLFDKMTRTLTRTFNAPIALITLIDQDRQHFKSQFGLPDELSAICDIPRSDSVCTHVVADNTPLIVEDLSRDRRFAKNALMKKYNLRFYAGIPLHAPNGQPVGALCILDTKPRKFSDAELRLLKIMADDVSETLAARSPATPTLKEEAPALANA